MTDEVAEKPRSCWLGVSELYRLDSACARLQALYPFQVYLVGSVLERRNYRDVDIRLLITDKKWSRHLSREWLFFNAAISDQLAAATGLPIDFQFQSRTEWDMYKDRPVRPLGHLPRRKD
jgi:hypothetical protein